MSIAATLSLGLAVLALGLPASGADLTGTWDGRYVCTRNDGGEHSRQVDRDVELMVSQTGNVLRAMNRFTQHYAGVVVDDDARPDSRAGIALSRCILDNRVTGGDELGVLSVVVNAASGTGRMRGTSHQAVTPGIYLTCKWRLRRVDTADPAVPPCP